MRVWKAFRVAEAFDKSRADGAEAVLLDGPANGVPFDWRARARRSRAEVIVAGGLDASNVAEAIRIAAALGRRRQFRLESSPGIKDHEKVRAIRRRLRGEAA